MTSVDEIQARLARLLAGEWPMFQAENVVNQAAADIATLLSALDDARAALATARREALEEAAAVCSAKEREADSAWLAAREEGRHQAASVIASECQAYRDCAVAIRALARDGKGGAQ